MSKIIERISNGLYILLFGFVSLWISLGFLEINVVYQFLRLWPLFFVVVGIDMICRKTKLSFIKILSPIIVVFAVFGIAYVYQDGDLFEPRKIETYKINQEPVSKDKVVDINLDFSSGTLFINENESNLITGDLSVSRGVVPYTYYREFDIGDIYEISGNSLSNYIFSPWEDNHLWDLKIGKELPVRIKANTKMSVNKFNAANLNVSEFILDSNLSDNEIIVNNAIKKMRIKSRGSKINLRIPREMGVKISLDKFLITDNFNDIGMERSLKEYTSSNYDSVIKKVDIEFDLMFSKIDVRYY
ncbi:hypothetical protein K0B03_01115 [Patescibacteria group bacterium]|nr:hypothetical protein [Patescibacteria group bacterium]